MIKTLDGKETDTVCPGERYLVPSFLGLPVCLPSHVDEGTEGRTSKHYHVDHRFLYNNVDVEHFDLAHMRREGNIWAHPGDMLNPSIVQDTGQQITYEQFTAVSGKVHKMSGENFTSKLWLYLNLGTQAAKDGRCVHHPTALGYDIESGCLRCPAHGLKFNVDGSPRYKAPFWIRFNPTGDKVPASMCPVATCSGTSVSLLDNEYEVIDDFDVKSTFNAGDRLNFGAWPKSGFCPKLIDRV